MSKAATKNRDRRREYRRVEIPPHVAALLEPGSQAYVSSGCRIIVSQQKAGWHLSITHPRHLPSWEDVRDARYAFIPDDVTMALLLPPRSEYVNVHEFCLQMYEIPSEYIEDLQDRL
jgi:hypothetical protein